MIHKGPRNKYIISEHQQPPNAAAWVEVETYGCEPFEDYSEDGHHFFMHACNGYLMVITHNCGRIDELVDEYLDM